MYQQALSESVPAQVRVTNRKPEIWLRRKEVWGQLSYSFHNDLFYADVHSDHPETATLTPEAPIGIYWVITSKCNLQCIHCYGNNEEFDSTEPSSERLYAIADALIESNAMRITITGGETLLRPETPSIIEHLSKHGVAIVLGTNGSFITKSNINALTKLTLVEISLDSHLESINNSIRISRSRQFNAFQDTINAIKICLEHSIKPKVLTCLNKYNYRHLKELAAFIYKLGIRNWGISWTLPAGRSRSEYEALVPHDKEQIPLVVEEIRNEYPELQIKYSNRTDTSINNRLSCLVSPQGDIFTEDLVLGKKIRHGSILNHPIQHYWNDTQFNRQQHFNRWVNDRITIKHKLYVG